MTDLNQYMKYAERFPLLTQEEVCELVNKYKETGDVKYKNKIVNHNLRLVVKISYQYKTKHRWDLIQEGNLGLMRAIDRFDPVKGVKFSYYASFWIKARMFKHIMESARIVKFATTAPTRKLFFNLAKAKASLEARGMELNNAEIAKFVGVNEKDVSNYEKLFLPVKHITTLPKYNNDSPSNNGIFFEDKDDICDEETMPDNIIETVDFNNHLNAAIEEFKSGLKNNERIVFERKIEKYDPDTFEQIRFDIIGRSGEPVQRQRVQQIHAKVKTSFSKFLNQKGLAYV